jgi:hypothetical protein
MNYKPYSPEWHRYRYLKEAIDKYLEDYEETNVIIADILDVLNERSDAAFREYEKIKDISDWISQGQ